MEENVAKALEVALRFGGIDGDHHKAWVIDQMVRSLLGNGYEAWVVESKDGDDGPDSYTWEQGMPP